MQYDAWLGSNHERAMQIADPKTVRGDFRDASLTHFGIRSRFFKRDGKFFVRTEGPDGKLADFEIKYTFGVEPLQQYLIEFPGGRLQSLTLAWDTRPAAQGGQRWFALYPNERIAPDDPLHWSGPDQNWNYQCAACHSTNLHKNYDVTANRYTTTWSDIDVACEACHGPGSRHVEWAKVRAPAPASGPSLPAGDDGLAVHFEAQPAAQWTFDPLDSIARRRTGWNRPEEINVCAPCHSRRSVIGDDYVPGQPLLESYVPALLTEGLYHADGQIDGEVYEYGSFLQSRMYQRGVSCTNCHEPHSLKLRAPGNAVCGQCHRASKYDSPAHHFHRVGSTGATCTGCHMPTKTYMVVHARHDHSLRVPRPDLSVAIGTPNACTQCHGDRSAEWARDQVRAWYGHDAAGYQTYARALHAGRTGSADALLLLKQLATDTAQPGIARATALQLLRTRVSPTTAGAVQAGLADGDALVRRAGLECLEAVPPAQRLKLAAPLLDDPVRAVRIEAARQLAAVPTDELEDALRARIDRGIAEYVAAERVDDDRPEARTNLGTLYAERGQGAQAEAEFRAAITLQRGYTPAYVNLADLYRVEQRDADGERVLRAGLTAAPDDAALDLALGLLLARQKRLPEAIDALQRAATLRPDDPHYGYVLGVALHSSGQTERALLVLSAAAARHPSDRELLLALATINRDAGHRDTALEYARQLAAVAPEDPSVMQLVTDLGGQQ
ncbi:MAG TPA: tetratricopeptide repeat protein [Steroidobacteraceae bacterium]|nr:tetratricopeptide repeat protein [Steroidobacteraceae bacterium]